LRLTRIPAAVLMGLLRAYKFAVSPFSLPACRYTPTCSEYALEAIDRHGALRGVALAAWRLLRCHPFVRGGYDPVPSVYPQLFKGARSSGTFSLKDTDRNQHVPSPVGADENSPALQRWESAEERFKARRDDRVAVQSRPGLPAAGLSRTT
jgi:putative membrane protein insertion efficiency factor